jgi:peptidoglycan/LPS O-acetylase OafA/YrhL
MNAWSLQFEMLFYAAATVAVGVVGSWRWLIGAYALAMAGAFLHGGPALRFTGNPLILEFLAGVAIARAPRFPIPAAVTALVLGAALLALTARFDLAEMANPLSVFELTRPERTMLWGVPVALIVAGAVGLERLFAWRGLDAAVFLGDASYSTYLVPPLVTNFFTGPWPIIEIALGLLIGAGAFRYVERPVVQWIRRRLLPPAAAMAAAAA